MAELSVTFNLYLLFCCIASGNANFAQHVVATLCTSVHSAYPSLHGATSDCMMMAMSTPTHLSKLLPGKLKHTHVHVGGWVEAAAADQHAWLVWCLQMTGTCQLVNRQALNHECDAIYLLVRAGPGVNELSCAMAPSTTCATLPWLQCSLVAAHQHSFTTYDIKWPDAVF